jgi:hypothetical protein
VSRPVGEDRPSPSFRLVGEHHGFVGEDDGMARVVVRDARAASDAASSASGKRRSDTDVASARIAQAVSGAK